MKWTSWRRQHGAGSTDGNWITDHPDVRKGFEDAKVRSGNQSMASLQAPGELAAGTKMRDPSKCLVGPIARALANRVSPDLTMSKYA